MCGPTTLATIRAALTSLPPEKRDRVVVAMVTVDPDRDSPEVLRDYLAAFDAEFLGLSGTEDQLQTAYDAFGVKVTRQPLPGSDLGYTVDHTASVLVIDPDGNLREHLMHGTTHEHIASDLNALLEDA
jgi:protein SCO1/2